MALGLHVMGIYELFDKCTVRKINKHPKPMHFENGHECIIRGGGARRGRSEAIEIFLLFL